MALCIALPPDAQRVPRVLCALMSLTLLACGSESSDDPLRDSAAPVQTADSGSAARTDEATGPDSGRDLDAGTETRDATAANAANTNGRDASRADAASPRDAATSTRDATSSNPADATTAQPDASSATGQCGSSTRVDRPFGCSFAWGANDPVNTLAGSDKLGFVTKWVGYEVDKEGNLPRCDGCSWLTQMAKSSSVPVYYAYFIGFLGSANGFADQNVNPNGPNLATDGAQLIRSKRAKLIDLYASYAAQSARAFPDKPVVWLLEGDFVQYTYKEQKQTLSMQELATLARDISCAIKSNMPRAVVAINHTTWLSDEVTNQFWDAMASVNYDLVWTTGVADNMGFLERNAKADTYNAATATFAYVARKTGRKILVDTSFGLSGMADSWSTAGAQLLNQRIADGVLAANVTMPPANYVATTEALRPQLDALCK